MSAAQDAASPVGGTTWRGMGGTTKIALGATALAGVLAVILTPGFFGIGEQKEEKQKSAESAVIKPFEPAPRVIQAGAQVGPGVVGQGAAPRAHRLPPPLEIGAYVTRSAPHTAAPAAAPAAATAYAAQGAGQGGIQPVGYQVPGLGQQGAEGAPAAPGSLNEQVSGATVLHASRASILGHPDFTITAGSKIPCLPVEAADSSLGGFYTCRVPEAVRGTTQRYRLLPPGTLIFGQVKKGMDQGQERLGILFTRIQTAGDNFLIPLAAPGADAMGRPGLDGDLETFFWSKVGAVALYALIDAAQSAVTSGAQAAIAGAVGGKGGNSFTNLNFNSGGQSLASIALQNSINKPPRLRRDQALPMEVSVGQDLDFYDACIARMRVNSMACPAT
jgi:type IV secretion system protein VirB10